MRTCPVSLRGGEGPRRTTLPVSLRGGTGGAAATREAGAEAEWVRRQPPGWRLDRCFSSVVFFFTGGRLGVPKCCGACWLLLVALLQVPSALEEELGNP